MSGLFDTFNIGKRGLSVQQSNINTTSHNISNANTEGYSRQRSVAETTRPFGGMSKFDSCSVGQVGTGAEITAIQRIRNTFLDYQVRNETGKLGNYEVSRNFLSQVEDVFGEPSDTAMQKTFSKFYAAFQELAKTPEKSSARTVALEQCTALADRLNQTYTQLENKINDAQGLLQDNITTVNSYLDQINQLNKQIGSVAAVGQAPNDLMDKRDLLLDKVSKLLGITVDKEKRETINLKADGFQAAGNVIDNLVNSSPTDNKYTRFSYVNSADVSVAGGVYTVTVKYYPLGNSHSTPKTIKITDPTITTAADAQKLASSLMQNRILTANKDGDVTTRDATGATQVIADGATLTDQNQIIKSIFKTYEVSKNSTGTAVNSVDPTNIKGEIAGNQSAQNMIVSYMKDLDRIAATLAYSVNAIQTGSNTSPASATGAGAAPDGVNYNLIFVNSKLTSATSATDTGITAKNIAVNKKVLDDIALLNPGDKSTDGERTAMRAQAIADLRVLKLNISNITDVSTLSRASVFSSTLAISFTDTGMTAIKGDGNGKTVDTYYKDMVTVLGTDSEEATNKAANQKDDILQRLEMEKLEESGVSLDEEMTNLIQYQHAYQASAKVISTVDQLLDVVINGLKR